MGGGVCEGGVGEEEMRPVVETICVRVELEGAAVGFERLVELTAAFHLDGAGVGFDGAAHACLCGFAGVGGSIVGGDDVRRAR